MFTFSRPTLMGPPPTSHFHILADTPAGLQPVNPPKTAQPSAARTMFDTDGKRVDKPATNGEAGATSNGTASGDKKPTEIGTDFGLRTDQYDKRNAALKKATAAVASRFVYIFFGYTTFFKTINIFQRLDGTGDPPPARGTGNVQR